MGPVGTVLVVEDDRDIRDLVRRYLERAGHAVLSTGSGVEGLKLLTQATPDLVVLDLGLPDLDGLEVLREAVAAGGVPVIVLTARVGAVLARTAPATADDTSDSYGDGRLVIDAAMHRALLDGRDLDLTPTEWGVLTTLSSIPGRPFSRYELVNRVRGYEFTGYERSMDSHVKNLRHKLGPDGAHIVETVVGVGYRLGLRRDH
jgi:DNA-binding response OmpR family regulator